MPVSRLAAARLTRLVNSYSIRVGPPVGGRRGGSHDFGARYAQKTVPVPSAASTFVQIHSTDLDLESFLNRFRRALP
jgi:hypothetical protein